MSRSTTIASLLGVVCLGGLAAYLAAQDRRRREQLVRQAEQFERDAEERTREFVELSTHLQNAAEREKALLARELHDEFGGLLVGALMDISWAEQHLPAGDVELKQRLRRVQQNLSSGIDLKRRIIEELRPTLLDNVGFIAALRWQFKETCARAGLQCIEYLPDEEPKLTPDAAIALYRVAQEAFLNITKHAGAKSAELSLDIDEDDVVLRIKDDGRGILDERLPSGSFGLVGMRQRVWALGGSLRVQRPAAGGTAIQVRIPLARALRPVAEVESL